jgi:hypothetical protein
MIILVQKLQKDLKEIIRIKANIELVKPRTIPQHAIMLDDRRRV